jgi:hypothetical protein
MLHKPIIATTEKTMISDRLHKQALAWFEDHPQQDVFVRHVVPGEFSASIEAQRRRALGGVVTHCYVRHFGDHLVARIPLTADMLKAMSGALDDTPLVTLSGYRRHSCPYDKGEVAQGRQARP